MLNVKYIFNCYKMNEFWFSSFKKKSLDLIFRKSKIIDFDPYFHVKLINY